MDFAAIQAQGAAAFDATLAQGGTAYDAVVAYQTAVMTLRQEEIGSDLIWLCPVCNKIDTPVGTVCEYCVLDEREARADRQVQAKARHGT